ncbi:hypothetical protein DFH08DRAFT_1083482 [Mycena albidolilacea]|uniref:Novel STAND NTPase 1 domain-containing protein n=1 Tax=Mycena albidolilacea TaxID=1033008 RepID=A0AAD6ZQ03_9AGAR|nr:hypothetical protein DFH08DRAFT_1083482 [Mycena albidolilacea]
MPFKMTSIPTISGARLKNTVACLGISISLLNDLHDAFATPFIPAIVNTVLSLVLRVQNVTRNKDECVKLTESIYGLIYASVNLHLNLEAPGSLPPAMMHHIGKFTETLHKIHTYVEAQQGGSQIKHFFRQSEMTTLLGECRAGLKEALNDFQIQTGFTVLANATASERSSLMYPRRNESQESSGSFSMLPSQPKIFHGRESELQSILELLHQNSARIAILGAGGMGKTSLAKAALYHPDVIRKYDLRFFVACDSAGNSVESAALICDYVGPEPAKDLRKPVVQLFATKRSCILGLDNLETPWETRDSRGGVEEFLSLLTDLPHLHLLITMRARLRKPSSTSPMILTIQRMLSKSSASDNLPLAVNLIAHLVDYEGCSNVLARWELEKTFILSGGYDWKSSLDAYGAGRIHAREAQRLAALAANIYEEANSFGSEALCSTALGDYKSSILRLQRAKDLMELCGMSAASDSILSSRAEVHLLKSEYAEARSIHVQLIDNTPQNNTYSHGFALIGAYGDVLPNLDRATAIFRPTHQCLKSSWNQDQKVVTYCLERLADISQWSKEDSDWVFACTVMYLVHAHRLKQKLHLQKALQSLGEMFIVTEDDETAHNLFAVALEGFTAMDVHRSRAHCLLAEKRGNSAMAAGLWREAQPLFEKSSQGRDVERVQSRLTLIGRPLVNAGEVDTWNCVDGNLLVDAQYITAQTLNSFSI